MARTQEEADHHLGAQAMFLLTLHNGRRGLYLGRESENCVFVKLHGERYWWWVPRGMVARTLELPVPGIKAA